MNVQSFARITLGAALLAESGMALSLRGPAPRLRGRRPSRLGTGPSTRRGRGPRRRRPHPPGACVRMRRSVHRPTGLPQVPGHASRRPHRGAGPRGRRRLGRRVRLVRPRVRRGPRVGPATELRRMAGSPDNLFIVFVEPWSLTASLYPGARWTGGQEDDYIAMTPITTSRKLVAAGGIARIADARNSLGAALSKTPRKDAPLGGDACRSKWLNKNRRRSRVDMERQ
jgi:hypothetical protein